jgi:hypothetical protein
MYCSKVCREKDYKEGHKKICCRPPIQVTAGSDERQLFMDVFEGNPPPLLVGHFSADGRETEQMPIESTAEQSHEEDMDDEGSWESIDSSDEMEDQENKTTRTTLIYQYFDKHTYSSWR